MGFLFSEVLERHELVAEKLRGIVFGFMSPVFFFKAGAYMLLKNMNLEIFILTTALFFIAFFSKYFSAKFTLRVAGFEDKTLRRVGGMILNFRLTFGIVAALFGLREGIISFETYTAIIAVILVSSIIASILIRVSAPKKRLEAY